MPRSVTPPADGAECGYAGRIEIAPQESRRRSRLGGATAVASLARHGICVGVKSTYCHSCMVALAFPLGQTATH